MKLLSKIGLLACQAKKLWLRPSQIQAKLTSSYEDCGLSQAKLWLDPPLLQNACDQNLLSLIFYTKSYLETFLARDTRAFWIAKSELLTIIWVLYRIIKSIKRINLTKFSQTWRLLTCWIKVSFFGLSSEMVLAVLDDEPFPPEDVATDWDRDSYCFCNCFWLQTNLKDISFALGFSLHYNKPITTHWGAT